MAEMIVVAAGHGSRMGTNIKKQYLPLAGKPILIRTLETMLTCPSVERILLVVSPDDRDFVHTLLQDNHLLTNQKPIQLVDGGKERQDSVRHGLEALNDSTTIVAVHDAARPLVTINEVEAVIEAAQQSGAATLGVPVKDTIKRVEHHHVRETLPREQLWAVHTPQAFRRDWLQEAHQRSLEQSGISTDDASLVEWTGRPVLMVEGSYTNLKITTPEDLLIAEAFWNRKGNTTP